MLRPCIAFASNSPTKQLLHVLQEVGEVIKAFIAWKVAKLCGKDGNTELEHLGEEATDLQIACETFLLCIGFNDIRRMQIKLRVIDKNGSAAIIGRD